MSKEEQIRDILLEFFLKNPEKRFPRAPSVYLSKWHTPEK